MSAGMYRIRVVGELDSSKIRAELDALSKQYGAFGVGKGGAYGAIGKDAGKAGKQIKGANGQIVATQKGMKKLGSETLNVTKKVVQFGAVTAVIRGVTSGMGDMVQKTFELDAALTEFKKVSDLSGKSLEKYTDQAFQMGRSVAKTGTEMIEAATEFRKSGFNDQDSLKLGQVAMMFSNIADSELSAGDAAGFITSQFKASFKDISTDATKASQQVIDAINEVSNTQAVSSTDLSMAMSKVASAMKVNNNTYAQSLGMVTAGTEIMHGQASKVGRGLRTIGANISKLQKDAKTLDVQTKDGIKTIDLWDKETNQIKSTYEVFEEFAGVWDEMTPDQQQALSLQMAGKNQQEVFASVIGNWKNAQKAAETATQQINEGGSALKENAKYLESMQGHLENLKSAWSEFSNAIMSSGALNKGMDILANILRFLSSDAGKTAMVVTSLGIALNIVAKSLLGLKGLSIIKLVKDIGKLGKGATDIEKAGAPLLKTFGKLSGVLMSPVGLVTGIGLLSVALAEFVPIGERAADIKLGKELKKAQSEVEETEKKYKSLSDELEKLQQKEKDGTITDSESNRLSILENQTKQLERQLELKKEIAGNKADEYYHTVDPSKLTGRAKDKYTLAKSAGKSDKEALAASGINDKIALSLDNVKNHTNDLIKAQQELQKAYEHNGEDSEEYKKALENLNKVQDQQKNKQGEQIDGLTKLENVRKKAIKDFGSEEEASKKLGQSWKDLNKEIKALKVLKELNFKKPAKNMESLKKNANALGLEFGKAGKNIRSIDLKTFSQQMAEAGYNTEDTWEYLQALGKENPKMKIDIDGTKVALEDLKFVDGKIQEVNNTEAEVDIEAKDNATAKMNKIKKDKNLGKAQKRLEESGGNKVKTTMGKLTNTKSLGKANKNITQTGGDTVESKLNTIKGKSSLGTATKTIHFSLSGAISAAKKVFGFKRGIRHFAGGGINDDLSVFANAEVNEQGFEIIRDAKTGMFSVVNGGKRGYTHLNKGDSVYTHNQSVRMLRNAGLTEGNTIYGHGNNDFALLGMRKLEGFAKGLSQKEYNKKYNALTSAYDKALATLDYKREKNKWSDNTYRKKYKALYKKYQKKLKALNKKKVQSKVKQKKSLGTDRARAYSLAVREIKSDAAKQNIENYISGHRMTNSELKAELKRIKKARKEKKISAEEADAYRKEAYKKNLEYNLKQYNNDKKTYKDTLALVKKYYNDARITSEEYYQYLEELAQSQLNKEKERLSEQKQKTTDTYDLARAYVERQISLLETENEEQEEQNELIELQNNLAKARNQRVRIYKEGEGFVYEQDTEAIREATQALQEYQSSNKNVTNPVLQQWKEVLQLFDDLEADNALRQLEIAVGSNVTKLFGGLGTDTSAWSTWIKNNLAKSGGLQNVLDDMDKLVDTDDILAYLNANGHVKQSIIDAAVKNNVLPATYASQITQAAQASALATSVVTAMGAQGAMATMANGTIVSGSATTYGNVYNFDSLVLPNVTNASEFINELNNLTSLALQASTTRT